jgi:putative sterol carrier protein
MVHAYFSLHKLTGPSRKSLGETFHRMAELLHENAADEAAHLQFRILDGDRSSVWTLASVRKRWQVGEEEIKKPDFEIITDAETWWQVADGKLSPFRAFLQGKMRVRGDVELGKRVLARISTSAALSVSAEQGAE